jgi:hypothetical protein
MSKCVDQRSECCYIPGAMGGGRMRYGTRYAKTGECMRRGTLGGRRKHRLSVHLRQARVVRSNNLSMGVMAIRGRLQRMGETPLEAAAIHDGCRARELGGGVYTGDADVEGGGLRSDSFEYILPGVQPTPYNCSVNPDFCCRHALLQSMTSGAPSLGSAVKHPLGLHLSAKQTRPAFAPSEPSASSLGHHHARGSKREAGVAAAGGRWHQKHLHPGPRCMSL